MYSVFHHVAAVILDNDRGSDQEKNILDPEKYNNNENGMV